MPEVTVPIYIDKYVTEYVSKYITKPVHTPFTIVNTKILTTRYVTKFKYHTIVLTKPITIYATKPSTIIVTYVATRILHTVISKTPVQEGLPEVKKPSIPEKKVVKTIPAKKKKSPIQVQPILNKSL